MNGIEAGDGLYEQESAALVKRPEMYMCNSYLFLLLKQHGSAGGWDGSAQETYLN